MKGTIIYFNILAIAIFIILAATNSRNEKSTLIGNEVRTDMAMAVNTGNNQSCKDTLCLLIESDRNIYYIGQNILLDVKLINKARTPYYVYHILFPGNAIDINIIDAQGHLLKPRSADFIFANGYLYDYYEWLSAF